MRNWLFRILRPIFHRSRVEREMDTELRYHFDHIVENFMRQGMSRDEAARRARLEFGGMDQVKDDAREARMADRVDRVWRELKYAARSLAKSPAFTAIGIATLALGIGANTVLFSLVDQMILREMPVKDPQRLVVFHSDGFNPGMDRANERKLSFSYPKYRDFRDRSTVFDGVAARFTTPGSVEYNGATDRVYVELVTGNIFEVAGVSAAAGRLIGPDDNRTLMGHPIVVLGYSYWQRRFAGDRSIIGRKVRIDGMPMTVIGVSAAGFHSFDRGSDDDVRIPLAMKDLFTPAWPGRSNRFQAWLNIVARLKYGISLQQAEAGANVLYRQILERESKSLTGINVARSQEFVSRHLDLWPAGGGVADQVSNRKTFLLELLAITGVVLLIACVNLAALLMARTAARQREIAIRLALGAGRMGVIRQILAENLLLAAAGGVAGFALAALLSRPAARFLISPDADRLVDASPDARVLLFALAAAVFTALMFAVTPVFQTRNAALASVLKIETGASSTRGQVLFRKGLVALQLSFCVWLMIAAGLFARSLAQLRSVDLGFEKQRLITFQLDPVMSGYKPAESHAAYQRINEALSALPGVTSVADSDYGVMTGNVNNMPLDIDGYRPARPDDAMVRELIVTDGYLGALGMRLLEGRDLTPADMRQPVHTALVNAAFAKQYFGVQSPVGRHIRYAFNKNFDLQIVGVISDQRYDGPATEAKPFYYLPFQGDGEASYYVRTAHPPETLLSAIRRAIEKQAPGVPIHGLRTMEELVDLNVGSQRRMAELASFFGLLATLLAAIGLYGVMAYTVARRTREIGIRMALGARPGDVLGMVIRETGTVVALGLLIGIPSGLAMASLVRSQLYHISPNDPASIAAAGATVAAVALLAGFLPARRATGVDPMRALRWE